MQDDEIQPQDNQEPHDQSPPDPRQADRKEETQAPENAPPASPSPNPNANPQAPAGPQEPKKDKEVDLNIVDLNFAHKFYSNDADGQGTDGVPGANAEFAEQFARVKAKFRKSAGRERYRAMDAFTYFEIGMDVLDERLPYQHPDLGDIVVLCSRLRENIRDARINGEDNNADRHKIIRELDVLSRKVIQISFEELCRSNSAGALKGEGDEALPKTQAEVAIWYTNLTWHARCYVIAACVLQGAPAYEVSGAANELYVLIEQAYPQREATPRDGQQTANHMVGPVFVSAEDLLANTYTLARKFEGAERIMWRDETFDLFVREFLARQAMTVGMRFADRNLLDILEEWAVSGHEERALRAGRVLAEIWWRQHQDKLLVLAEAWARDDEENVWMGGATLLYGGYAAERAEHPEMKAADSEVLHHLRIWADWREDTGLAQVAAYTYSLIGRQWPETALDGLDHLLCMGTFSRTNNAIPPLPVTLFAMLSYMEIAVSGHIRPLLKRFASHAKRYAYDAQRTSRGAFEEEQSYVVRQRSLDLLFFHILFLVGLSLEGVRQGKGHASYLTNVELPPFPYIPSSRGQDVLLAGVLSVPEQEWRTSVQTIFCAAIFSRREQFVFEILSSWIHIVTYEPHGDATNALLQFVVDMHAQLSAWDKEQQHSGIWAGSSLLEQQLSFWTKATRETILRPFARRALDAIHK